jgi:hypothetical protein
MNAPLDTLIAICAAAQDSDAIEFYDAILELRPLLDQRQFELLCCAFEICPIHECDFDTCADDDQSECEELRNGE